MTQSFVRLAILHEGERLRPGVRVIIGGSHPVAGYTGTIREVQRVQPLFGGGVGYAVEVDGMAGHRVGCRALELTVMPEPKKRKAKKR